VAKDRAEVLKKMRDVLRIQRRHAGHLIASGVFNDCDDWTDVVDDVAAQRAEPVRAVFEELCNRLEAAAPDSTKVPNVNSPGETEWAYDLMIYYGTVYMDAGFSVGLAVGMQLGPHAFDGVDATKGRR
jgi:hypothetical protein